MGPLSTMGPLIAMGYLTGYAWYGVYATVVRAICSACMVPTVIRKLVQKNEMLIFCILLFGLFPVRFGRNGVWETRFLAEWRFFREKNKFQIGPGPFKT